MKPEQKEEFKLHLAQLFAYQKKKLKLKSTPKVVLVSDQKNADKMLGKTGYYDPDKREVHLFITDRHPKDILRSFAHEIIHHWQHENEQLETSSKKGGGNAGEDPQYAQHNPWLRQMEKQAYLLGNIMFRDWEDEKKNKDRKSGKKMAERTMKIGVDYPPRPGSNSEYKDLNEGIGDYLDKIGTFLVISGMIGGMIYGFNRLDKNPGEDLKKGLPVEIKMSFRDIGGEKGEKMRQVFDEYFKDEMFTVQIDPEISQNVEVDYDQKSIKVKNAEVLKSLEGFKGMMMKSILQRGAERFQENTSESKKKRS